MICDELERHLDSYVDRESAPDTDAAIRDHLHSCAVCRRRLADRQTLGRLVRSAPYYTAPDRLRARVSGQLKRSRSTYHLVGWAAAAVLTVAVGTGGVSLVRSMQTAPGVNDALVEDVVGGHVRSLMADHLFDVESTDQHTVKPWFLGKLDFAPPVADLASAGFPLVGGRLDYLAGEPVAALVYRRQKHTINVFISPAREGARASASLTVRGFHVHHWVREGMSFWAVSDLNEAELSEFVRTLEAS